MDGIPFQLRHIIIALAAAPILVFAGYVAWLVVPEVVREVVPAVVRAVNSI
jgi:hypothetical protein